MQLETVDIDGCFNRLVICEGPGSLHAIEIGNAGSSAFVIRDGRRPIFRMPFAFSGSFFLEAGFNDTLEVEVFGSMSPHLQLSFRRATPSRANAKN